MLVACVVSFKQQQQQPAIVFLTGHTVRKILNQQQKLLLIDAVAAWNKLLMVNAVVD